MKIDTNSIINQYDKNLENYKQLADNVYYLLQKEINTHKIKIHSLTYRIKEVDSLLDKVRRKNIANPFEQIDDLVGFRVVCLFLPDLDEIGNIIRNGFDIFSEDHKVRDTEISIFGYMSLHLKGRLRPSSLSIPNQELDKIPFEIYKKDRVIPEEMRRDFHALSGLFYVADTHFSLLRQEQSKQIIEENIK
jgi:ppGpp synthetase/RelA/SpoT-type nucleotidyltranferase